jgi:hypothetical protein
VIDEIRHATNKGNVLGFDGCSELERALGRPLTRGTHGGARRLQAANGRRPRARADL